MDKEQAFLQAIRRQPGRSDIRLVYADWLIDHGDPRGEFIHCQVQAQRLPRGSPRRLDREARAHDLLLVHEADWLGPLLGAVANWECPTGAMPASSRLELLALVTRVCFEWLATGRGPVGYRDGADAVPAADADQVHGQDERRLLMAFRLGGRQTQRLLLTLVEARFPAARGRRGAWSIDAGGSWV